MANYVATVSPFVPLNTEDGNTLNSESGDSVYIESSASTVPLSGSGMLAATTAYATSNSVTLSGNGALSVSNVNNVNNVVVRLSGSGALATTNAQVTLVGDNTINNESDQSLSTEDSSPLIIEGQNQVNLVGSGALAASFTTSNKNSTLANLTGSGNLVTANVIRQYNPSVALTGNGGLTTTVAAKNSTSGTINFVGSGNLAITNSRGTFPYNTVDFQGYGSLSVQRILRDYTTSISLTGSGSLSSFGRAAQVGVPAPGVLAIKNNRNITGYSVEENATPINAASTEGGVGTISFGFPQRSDWLMLFEQDIELDDDYRGTTSGKIAEIHAENGLLSITANNRLTTMIGDTQAYPKDGTFEAIARYYLALGQITENIYFHSDVRDIPVTVPGWHGDAWLNLKQLCTAYNVEVSLVSNNVSFRPIRSLTVNPQKIISLTEDLTTGDLARTVEINYYENEWKNGALVYPRTIDEMKNATVYQVEANSVVEDDIQLTVSLASIIQPVCVDDVAQAYDGTNSVYSVRGVDNSQITAQQWAARGGSIELTINEDTSSVHIKITGPTDQYYSPYRICGRVKELNDLTQVIVPPQSDASVLDTVTPDKTASKGSATTKPKKETAKEKADRLKKEAQEKAAAALQAELDANKQFADPSQSEEDYPSLRLVGTGTHQDKKTLTLPTGVPEFRTAADVGATVDNPYITALEDAYRIGTVVASAYRGEDHEITATLGQINQRMGSGSIAYRTVGDIESQHQGMTIGQFDDTWRGKTIADFNAAQKALVVDNFDNQVFGNVPGTRFQHGAAMFRITDSTTTESDVQITALRDTMLEEFADAHANQTIADFNNIYAGKTLKEFGRIPLLRS